MVENWELEWNSSMIEHGRDLGTMNFIFAKGGDLSDMNYVLFDVQDNSWEPLIKAVAERDNSHPDIIRKNAEPFFMQQGQRPAQQFMGTGVASPRQANKVFNTAQRMSNLANYANDPTAMNALRAGKYGTAAGKGLMAGAKGLYQGAGKLKEGAMNMGGRALQAVKESGMGQRMKNFMGGAGRAMSDLRHLPAAAKQSYKNYVGGREDEARRSLLESGLGRGQRELQDAEGRYVPGSQDFDSNMERARAGTSQGLARDYNVTPQLHTRGKNKGKPKESVEDAMRREVADIGLRRTGQMRDDKGNVVDRPIEEREGMFAGMRRRGDERREANRAQREGDAFAPSNIVPEQPAMPEAPTDTERPVQEPLTFDEPQQPAMPEAPSPEAEAAARADAPAPEPVQEPLTFDEPETAAPPDTGVVAPQPSQKATDAMAMFDKVQENKRKRMAMEGGGGEPTATVTEPTRGQQFATDAQMNLSGRRGADVSGGIDEMYAQHEKEPFADRDAAMQSLLGGRAATSTMQQRGKFTGKTKTAVEAALADMFGPAQAKQIVQSAEAGNQEAKEIVEEVTESQGLSGGGQQPIDFSMSQDKHVASWDALLKGLNIR